MPRHWKCSRLLLQAVCGAVLVLGSSACGSKTTSNSQTDAVQDTAGADVPVTPALLELRPLHTSADHHIVDDLDREVLLRGVNVTSLGEYWQGDPDHLPTQALTEADWQEMAATGFSVIRLVVHWSRLEPTRGAFDTAYVAQIDAYVKAAADHGIYTVIDMHQDAYTAFLHTDNPAECTGTTAPAKGWDGAPKWAVIDDGLSTCISGDRNSSPAVTAAWNHFYANSDGIRDRFVATWGALAKHFAGRPEVAGYNLLNEPEVAAPAAEIRPLYNQLLADTTAAIRAAEAGASFGHLIIIELAFAAGHPEYGLVIPDPSSVGMSVDNVVYGPHNYAEAIGNGLGLDIGQMSDVYKTMADKIGAPMWIGEHGFWSTSADTLEKLGRYALDEDAKAMGGAWWQWRQPCGDPHSIPLGGYKATASTGQQIHLHGVGCPGDKDLGPTEPLLRVVRRGYPRVTPGRISLLTSDADTGALHVEAQGAKAGARLTLWTPTAASGHAVTAVGVLDLQEHPVSGGRVLTGTVAADGSWSLQVAAP